MSTEPATQQLLNAIRRLPRGEQLRLVERIVHDLAEEHAPSPPESIIGLFADQPDLIEAVSEEAMQARERDPFRLPDA
jgi:hypothetical protein